MSMRSTSFAKELLQQLAEFLDLNKRRTGDYSDAEDFGYRASAGGFLGFLTNL
jgi:hypothetical protein